MQVQYAVFYVLYVLYVSIRCINVSEQIRSVEAVHKANLQRYAKPSYIRPHPQRIIRRIIRSLRIQRIRIKYARANPMYQAFVSQGIALV